MADVFSFPDDKFVLIGKIAKPHGLRGEVKLHAFSDKPETLLQYSQIVLVDHSGRLSPALKVERSRLQGKMVVFKLETINDRDSAEAIYGKGILLDIKDLPAVEEGEYYWHQLYDLPVYTKAGGALGRVSNIFSNGAQDIMVITDNDREYLIPILDTIIKEHGQEGIIIDPPPGLLEINSATDK
jgi:16S rRNA processing protein RimM